MLVVPFNVMGSAENLYDKDARWWSTPYERHNKFFTGFAHGALSGVGCPDMGSLLTMATTGPLTVDYKEYGTAYRDEKGHSGLLLGDARQIRHPRRSYRHGAHLGRTLHVPPAARDTCC